MRLQDTLTKEVERERDPLLSIWNPGTLIFLTSYNLKRIMEKKSRELETYSTPYGFLISLCKESLRRVIGLSSVLMKLQDSTKSMGKNLRHSTLSMSLKEKEERPLKPKSCGKLSLIVKLRLVLLTCCIRIMLMLNPTTSIWVLLRVQICAAKLLNIPHPMK